MLEKHQPMKAILFDLDGVFYTGNEAISHAVEVAHWVKQNAIPHLYVTNTSSKPRSELVKKLAGFGIETTQENIFTPIVATISWLQAEGVHHHLALHIPESSQSEFSDFDRYIPSAHEPSAIIIGDLGDKWNYSVLNQIFRWLMAEPQIPFIALGMTRYWQAEDGLRLDVAPFIKALEFASGKKALVMGKPAKHFFKAAISQLEMKAEDVLMIGDDIYSDIEGAQLSGLQAWLVKTGKYRDSDLESGIKPDKIIDSVVDLIKCWTF